MAATVLIFNYMSHQRKAVGRQKASILICVQAGVVQLLALKRPDGLPATRARGKHECGSGCSMTLEYSEHTTLPIWGKVKKTVPGHNARELFAQLTMLHVTKQPRLIWEPRFTQGQQRS